MSNLGRNGCLNCLKEKQSFWDLRLEVLEPKKGPICQTDPVGLTRQKRRHVRQQVKHKKKHRRDESLLDLHQKKLKKKKKTKRNADHSVAT
ncbi:unnamed protein product [Leptidea sinapis]|uniref:Uncharacterized protein n=1 Tax=Leptidea sinapis TaxID=189913 RepID=A0A5E4PRE4_9NEOP|nr:unnamed protein product [Leptidea sinapis]